MDIMDMGKVDRGRAVEDLLRERTRQLEKGWSLEHDDEHTGHDWSWIIGQRVVQLLDPAMTCTDDRQLFIEIGAIALAAVQAEDRRHPEGHEHQASCPECGSDVVGHTYIPCSDLSRSPNQWHMTAPR